MDVRGFIAWFGGPAKMRETWERHGLLLTKGAQDKWIMRGSIPTSRILEATFVSKKMRKSLNINEFFKTRTKGDAR